MAQSIKTIKIHLFTVFPSYNQGAYWLSGGCSKLEIDESAVQFHFDRTSLAAVIGLKAFCLKQFVDMDSVDPSNACDKLRGEAPSALIALLGCSFRRKPASGLREWPTHAYVQYEKA
jgi:hypothetical protein